MDRFAPKQILVPTDFSELSTTALHDAVSWGRRFGSRISIVHADVLSQMAETVGFAPPSSSIRSAEVQIREYLEEHVPPELRGEARIVSDSPVSAVMTAAEDVGADLIVIGTHGRTGWNRVVFGSVAEFILRRSDIPVLALPVGKFKQEHRQHISRILVPFNHTQTAVFAYDHAASLAESFDSQLILLEVRERSSGDVKIPPIESWAGPQSRPRMIVDSLPPSTNPAEEILDYAETRDIDLLVVGAQHKRFTDTTIIGSTSEWIVRHSPTAVLTVVRRPSLIATKVEEEELTTVS